MSPVRERSTDYRSVDEALADLCDGLIEPDSRKSPCQSVQPDDIPAPYNGLLVHHDHMTARLEEYHGQPVVLRVLAYRIDRHLYRRKILLTLPGTDVGPVSNRSGQIVEYGIVRIDLRLMPEPVRQAVLTRRLPLGEILAKHNVLRWIDSRWYLRFPGNCRLLENFGCSPTTDVYGRLGTIYCNGDPAIELLEIVTGV